MNIEELELHRACTQFLSRHRPLDVRAVLTAMAADPQAGAVADHYGTGGAVAELERKVASLLGKESALFFVKGVIAQQCVLRVRSEESGSPYVAVHPRSHIDIDEGNCLEHLHGLKPVRLGRHAPFSATDLAAAGARLGSVVVELPLRRAGYLLTPWDDLLAISAWCRANRVAFHLDGARLWESAAGYGRSLSEVAALADSVYVSFYKGMGALGGCVVAGSAGFIDSLRIWKTRHGANLFTAFPFAISAMAGLDRYLPRMPDFVARARTLAGRITASGIGEVYPATPHVNAFQLVLPGAPEFLAQVHREFAVRERIWLFNGFVETQFADRSIGEIVIGDSADHYSDDMACDWLRRFTEAAGGAG